MATVSMNFRQRVLKAFDGGDNTREQVSHRFWVSLGMVNKLIQQRAAFHPSLAGMAFQCERGDRSFPFIER